MNRRMRGVRGPQGGQTLAEFALVAPVFITLISGAIDFGLYSASLSAVAHATRAAARYASINPRSWSAAQPAAAGSIQGVIQGNVGVANVINNDASITIAYYDISVTPATASAPVLCGTYSQASAKIVYSGTYDSSNCPGVGDYITVTVNYTYAPVTPLIGTLNKNGLSFTEVANVLELS